MKKGIFLIRKIEILDYATLFVRFLGFFAKERKQPTSFFYENNNSPTVFYIPTPKSIQFLNWYTRLITRRF